jgi:uncharacterized Zn-finger protein
MSEQTVNKVRHIEVTADDLLWNAHPRVFLPIEKTGEELCPYCGTRYTLKGSAAKDGH